MENILEDNTNFENVDIKTRTLNFQVNHEKRINDILKSLKSAGCLSIKQYKKIKAFESRPGVLYSPCKIHKAIVDVYPPFRSVFSAIGTPPYKIFSTYEKFPVHILSCFTIKEFTAKDSFSFTKEIVEQDSSFYMASLDEDSIFTNIPLEETINICTESLYDQNDIVDDLNKSELKELLSLSIEEFYFILMNLCKQTDCAAMGSPLGQTLANAFLCFS